MKGRRFLVVFILLLIGFFVFQAVRSGKNPVNLVSENYKLAEKKDNAIRVTGLHIPFVKNVGQFDRTIKYYADILPGSVRISREGNIIYLLKGSDGRIVKVVEKFGNSLTPSDGKRSVTRVNYFYGKNSFHDVPSFDSVSLKGVADRVNLELKAYQGKVEKIFEVLPGGSVSDIRVKVKGAKLVIEDDQLILLTESGKFAFSVPKVYQKVDGKLVYFKVKYRLLNDSEYGFSVGKYDKSKPLYIDPFVYGRYVGAGRVNPCSEDACGKEGGEKIISYGDYLYIAGYSYGDTPLRGNGYEKDYSGSGDAFVLKIKKDLSDIVSSTYLGGTKKDVAKDLLIDGNGNVVVAGYTSSPDFPITTMKNHNGGNDIFIAYLDQNLSNLNFSTLIGGSGNDVVNAIAYYDDSLFLSGKTDSPDFPVESGYDNEISGGTDGFVMKLGSDHNIVSSTFLGGKGDDEVKDMTIIPGGDVVVVGLTKSYDFPVTDDAYQKTLNGNGDAFIARFDNSLDHLLSSTYIGGGGYDYAVGVTYDSNKNIFITGNAFWKFPTSSGAFQEDWKGGVDTFIAKFSEKLKFKSATLFGGGREEFVYDICVDENGKVYVAGKTTSSDLPVKDGYDMTKHGYSWDGYIASLSNDLTSLNSDTFLGGSGDESVESLYCSGGKINVTGWTGSGDFPVSNNAFQQLKGGNTDIFISELTGDLSTLEYSTFVGGGSYTEIRSMAEGKNNDIYVAGKTDSPDLPLSGSHWRDFTRGSDGFVARISDDLSTIYSLTYIGGSGSDGVVSVEIGEDGSVFAGGWTTSYDFPVTADAYQSDNKGEQDIFLVKFSQNLDGLLASTYLGGSDKDVLHSIVSDGSDIFITGWTKSSDFPVNSSAYQDSYGGGDAYNIGGDVFIVRLDRFLDVKDSTYFGRGENDSGEDIYIYGENVYLVGWTLSSSLPVTASTFQDSNNGDKDCILAVFDEDLTSLKHFSYLGGSEEDICRSIVVNNGVVYIAGTTRSDDFPVSTNAYQKSHARNIDVFVVAMDKYFQSVSSATYFGGQCDDVANRIGENEKGIYITGWTCSDDLPGGIYTFQKTFGGRRDGFMVQFSPSLTDVTFFTYLGGSNYDDANSLIVESDGVFVGGWTKSSDFNIESVNSSFTSCEDGYIIYFPVSFMNDSFPIIEEFSAYPSSGTAPLKVTLSVNASDPDGDPLKYSYDCDSDGNYDVTDSSSTTFICNYSNPGTFTAMVVVSDGRGGRALGRKMIEVFPSSGSNEGSGQNNSGSSEGSNGNIKSGSSSSKKSSGCGCRVGESGNNWGDFVVMLFLLSIWIGVRRRERV